MRCLHCNEKLAPHDLWCVKCGRRTEVLSGELSAIRSIKNSWSLYRQSKGQNLPAGILAALTGMIPMLLLIWLLNFAVPAMHQYLYVLLHFFVWTAFVPVLLTPFKHVCSKDTYAISVAELFKSFSSYGSYLFFPFISVLFYAIIFYVCMGDPILNLVWLVLVLYWIAIALPVPVLMQRYGIHAWKAVKLSYKQAGDLRWNIFLLAAILAFLNIIAVAFFLIGLSVTIPFTWYAIRDYVDKMILFEVFEAKEKQ